MRPPLNKAIICANGFSMSVQASSRHYCNPRKDNALTYNEVEIGAITFAEDEKKPSPTGWTWATPFNNERVKDIASWKKLMTYGEFHQTDDPRLTVFSYVPMTLVMQLIEDMGGMTEGTLPNHDIQLAAYQDLVQEVERLLYTVDWDEAASDKDIMAAIDWTKLRDVLATVLSHHQSNLTQTKEKEDK